MTTTYTITTTRAILLDKLKAAGLEATARVDTGSYSHEPDVTVAVPGAEEAGLNLTIDLGVSAQNSADSWGFGYHREEVPRGRRITVRGGLNGTASYPVQGSGGFKWDKLVATVWRRVKAAQESIPALQEAAEKEISRSQRLIDSKATITTGLDEVSLPRDYSWQDTEVPVGDGDAVATLKVKHDGSVTITVAGLTATDAVALVRRLCS